MARFIEIGRRLHEVRSNKGLSIATVSQGSRLSEAQLEALERGETGTISTAALARVAKYLGLRDSEIWADDSASSIALYFKHSTVPDFFQADSQAAREALRTAEDVQDLEVLIGRVTPLRGFFEARPVASPAYEDGYTLARQVRRALHLKGVLSSDIATLPQDWETLVEDSFGIPILERQLATWSVVAFAAKAAALAAIVVNARHRAPPLARRVDVAHELAHALFDPPTRPIGLFIDREDELDDSAPNEKRARAFAAELLVPRAGLLSLLGSPNPSMGGMDAARRLVERAGAHFGSPVELTAHHLANNGYFSDALHEEVVRVVVPWEYEAPVPREPLLARRIRQGLDAGVLSEGRARELLGLAAWDAIPGLVR